MGPASSYCGCASLLIHRVVTVLDVKETGKRMTIYFKTDETGWMDDEQKKYFQQDTELTVTS